MGRLGIVAVFLAGLLALVSAPAAGHMAPSLRPVAELLLAADAGPAAATMAAVQSGEAPPSSAVKPPPAPFVVDHWEIVAQFGAAGPQHYPVADGFIFTNLGGLTALRVVMSKPVDPATLTADVVSLIGQVHGNLNELVKSLSLEDGGRTVVINLFDTLPDADRYTVTLGPGLKDLDGQSLAGKNSLSMAYLAGDVDATGTVTENDVAEVRKHVGESLSPSNYRYDVNSRGRVTEEDVTATQNLVGHALP